MFRSLFLKISLSVGAVVTLTLVSFAYFLVEYQKEHLLSAKTREVESLSTIARNGLASFMKEEGNRHIHNFLRLFGGQEGLMELRILDPDGTVVRSFRKREEGTAMASLLGGKNPSGKALLISEQEIGGRPFLTSLQALENGPGCFSCHGRDKKILGLLHVAVPMEMTQNSILFNRNLLIASTVITLMLMAAATNLLLNHLVKKPIGVLIQAMAQVEKGDLSVPVDLRTPDELGRLGQSLRSMVEKLSQAQKELERQQEQRIAQLRHLASLGELAASVAHEIKNPLAGIQLAIQVLAKEPELTASHRETIWEIIRSIERLDKTMADLLSYSRMRPPELQLVRLDDVVEDALSFIKEECQIAGVRVDRQLDPALPPLPLDSQQMERVFLNLFLNALQAMDRGGVLTIQTRRREYGSDVPREALGNGDFRPEEGWAEITVTDTGGGIPAEALGEIFRPFFTTKAKGTGLGLALAQRIVEQHHGQIFARNQAGGGAAFYLLLPLSSPLCKGEPE